MNGLVAKTFCRSMEHLVVMINKLNDSFSLVYSRYQLLDYCLLLPQFFPPKNCKHTHNL